MKLSLIQEKEKPKFFARCGLCCVNFKTKSGCDRHFRSRKHLERLTKWYELNAKCRQNEVFEDWNRNAKLVLEEEKREEVVDFD